MSATAPRDADTIAREARTQAERAREVLEAPGVTAAFEALAQRYLGGIRNSAISDHDGRETAFLMLRALDHLRDHLKAQIAGEAVTIANLRTRARSTP